MNKPATFPEVDAYIESFSGEVQQKLKQIRAAIRKAAPDAVETIKYGIPTFVFKGKNLVHFGGFKSHVSFFPTSSGTEHFQQELSAYKSTRGTIRFPLHEPLPLELITRITRFRVMEVKAKQEKKKTKM